MTRQHDQFLALMQNMDMALQQQTTEASSAGNAMARFGEYGKSTQAKLADLTNTMQQLWLSLISSDTVNGAVTQLTNLVSTIGHVTSTFGGMGTAIYLVVAALTIFKGQAIAGAITSLGEFILAEGIAATATEALSVALDFLMANPIILALSAVVAITAGLVGYANQQAKVQEQLDATKKSQVDFTTAVKTFEDTLDPKKIDDVTTALQKMKDAVNYTEAQKQIKQLETDIKSIQDTSAKRSLLPMEQFNLNSKTEALDKLKNQIAGVADAQKQADAETKLATTLDYASVQATITKTATTVQEIGSQQQLVKSYQSVHDKLTQGIALTENEKTVNQNMIDKYPQYIQVLNQKTGAVGINIKALGANLTAQEALAVVELNSLKATAKAQQIETQNVVDQTTERIKAIGAEIKALEAKNSAYAASIDSGNLTDAQQAQAEHNYLRNSGTISDATTQLALASKQLDTVTLTNEAYKTIANMSVADMEKGAPAGGSFEPPSAADTKAAKAASAAQAKADKAKAAADKKAASDAQKQADAVARAEEKVAVATKRVNDAKTVVQKESALDALSVANANLDAVNKAGATAESIAQARTSAITADASKASTDAIALIAQTQKNASDLIIAGYQAQIDAINKKTETETRTTQQLQYQNDLIKQQNDLTNAQNEKNVRVYQDGKWQWEADQTAVQTARDAVSTTQTASAKFKSDNANTDKIASLNASIKTEQDKQAAREKAASASVKGYATGTDNAEAGVKNINENGIEIIAGNKANFQGGEQVINANDTSRILNGDTKASLNTVGQSVTANDDLVKRPLDVLLSDINDNIQKFIDSSPKYAHDLNNNIGKSITNNDILVQKPLNTLVQDISNSLQHFVDMSPQYGKGMDKNMGDSVIANNALLITPVTVLIDKVKTGINAFVMDSYNSGTGMIDELGKGVTDSTKNITDIVKTLTDKVVAQFHTSFGIHSPSTVMHKIGEFLMQGLSNGISSQDINSFIQSQFTDMAASGAGAFGSAGDAMGGNVTDWLKKAMANAGVGTDWLSGLTQLVSRESGGNPTIQNPTSVMGQHATGLMQMLPSTFDQYKMSNLGDILNPIDNASSAIQYIKARYGSLSNIPGLYDGNYVGYQDGTDFVPKTGDYKINENGGEIVTLPQGAGVIKNSLTKNLMDWGKFNPNNFLKNILPKLNLPDFKINVQNQGSQAPITNIIVEHVELPNVSDSEGFINSLIQLSDTTA